MDKTKLFTSDTIEYMADSIAEARGQEVFFQAEYDKKEAQIKSIQAVSRGNEGMAPAIINNLKSGQVVIHNHPSGDLRPSAADIRLASMLGNQGIGFIIVNNQADESYIVVEPALVEELEPLNEEEIVKYFKPDGLLAHALPQYQERKEQIDVLTEIIQAFNDKNNLMVEAGTGTGKSFAYLIPALFWADQNGGPVVVSTNTINLQQQLINKDLVFLQKVLPFNFKADLVKGRSNYICRRKLSNLLKRKDVLKEEKPELFQVAAYIEDQTYNDDFAGSRSDVPFTINNKIWQEFASESDLCLNSGCPFLKKCFFQSARKSLYNSDLLIVNHHLLLADGVLKNKAFSVLPDYHRLIIDEAHNLPQVATRISGMDFYPPQLNSLLQKILHANTSPFVRLRNQEYHLNPDYRQEIIKQIDTRIWPDLTKIEEYNQQYEHELTRIFTSFSNKNIRLKKNTLDSLDIADWLEYGEKLIAALGRVEVQIDRLYDLVEEAYDPGYDNTDNPLLEISAYISRLSEVGEALELNLNYDDNEGDFVFWLEKQWQNNNNSVAQKNARIDVDDFLQKILFDQVSTGILTSATLAVDDSFSYFKNKVGLTQTRSLLVSSPFDYQKQVQIYLPKDLPAPNSRDFLEHISSKLTLFLKNNRGRTLILFTSYKMLNQFKDIYKTPLQKANLNLLVQGESPRHVILNSLKNQKRQILLGTSSFWEGIDVPGEALTGLIMMKLPFEVPTDPLVAARNERIKERGGNPFWEESLPAAVIKFKQGFGRLIRSKKDTGTIILLDRRLTEKRYGSKFINSLPKGCNIKRGWPEEVEKND
ncbi:MAG: helicase C-terminal domain-containing protein [Bacillota bacterium]